MEEEEEEDVNTTKKEIYCKELKQKLLNFYLESKNKKKEFVPLEAAAAAELCDLYTHVRPSEDSKKEDNGCVYSTAHTLQLNTVELQMVLLLSISSFPRSN
jgi:hypothetical protein